MGVGKSNIENAEFLRQRGNSCIVDKSHFEGCPTDESRRERCCKGELD
jgi:hypothetical protein